ncbi:hypothetical protein M0813_25335 [Anaeramoeba flamelloides]|uniref:Uncharacterized protein n=1 Tax=Anaeramoeba flamelloides TaxID=1746091 RepID=A0ABQ8Y2Q3_9EUKA|nr:hypothetical protein M0813_25335 [Anaeramoeba flamelloides]
MINNYIENENEENSYKINQNDNLLNAKAQIKMDNLINYNLIKNFKINPLSKINIPKLFQLNTQFWFDLMNKTELFNEFELNQLLFYDLDKYILYLNHVENNKKNKKKNQQQNSGNEIENYLCKPNNQLFFSHFFNTNFYKIQKIIKYCDQYIEMTKKMDFNKEFKIVEDSIIKNNKIFKNNLQNAYNQANIDQNSNLDAIQRELTNYLNSFFKYYHQFHENKKIHKNLDKEFLRKSRQLYRNVPVTINKTESITIPVTETYTTNEGTTSTRTRYDHETVHFTFHVTEIQKDNGVYHDIIRNRDQVTEYTNLSRNPNRKLPDETIKSIYFFEKWHSFLKLNVNLTKLAYEWSIKFNLFEESGNGKTLSHYSPWKHFRKHFTRLFSNSFILNNPLVLKDILLLILQNPHARIKNFSKYFNPNCNNELFIELFNLVFNHYNKQSKSNKKDFSKLFKNFNFQLYLNQLLPNEQFCNQFLMTFYSMINFQTFKDFLKIHNCFVNYLGQFLLYNFPVNYFNILNQIMKLFAIGESVPQLWAILLTIPQNYLKLDLVINTKTILTQNFNLKLQQLSSNKSNLYLFLNNPNIKYHSKVSSVATIIQFFEKLILSLPTELRNTENTTLQNIENVNYFSYKILIDLFNPFINNNYLINNNPYPAFIINKDQLPEISNLFQSFCKQLNFLNSNFLNVINYFFNDFSLNFVQNTPDIIAENVSNVLAFNINWTQLIINFNVLNHMIKISNTNWNRIIRLIIAKVNWLFYEKQLLENNNNNNNNNNNLENENNFHSMLFESICNVILNYSDFDIPIQYNNFVIMINNIINQINWNNYLKYEKYNSYLEFLTVDTKLINYNKDNRKGTNYLKEIKYNENMFTKEIKNKEQQLFLFIYFLKKIINFDNINNFNFKSTFCKTITKILELSSTILLLEDKIEIKKRRFRKNQEITLKRELPPVKQVSILSFELFETNFIKIWLELIKLSILNSDNNNTNNNVDNLQFPFDLILKNIINPQIQISLIENLCFFIEQNNKFSLPILKSISLEPKLIKNSIAVGETCILVYMNSYTNNWDFEALISHFNFIDVDQDQLTTNCIEQFAFTTVWLYLKKKFLSNVNNDNEQDNSTFKFDIIKSTEILNTIILKNKLKYGKEFTYILIVNLLFKYLNVANNLIDDNDFWKTIKYNLQFIAKKFEDLYNEKNTKDTLIDFDDSKLDLNYRLAFFTISTLINNGFAKPTNELIFKNETNKKTTKNAQNSLNNLTKLANNKHFKIFDKQINIFSEFITNNELTINNCLQLISHISNKLFTNHNDNFLTYFIN